MRRGCGITTLDEALLGRRLDVLAVEHADRLCFGTASVPWDCRSCRMIVFAGPGDGSLRGTQTGPQSPEFAESRVRGRTVPAR